VTYRFGNGTGGAIYVFVLKGGYEGLWSCAGAPDHQERWSPGRSNGAVG
jgi:hypothetical protein